MVDNRRQHIARRVLHVKTALLACLFFLFVSCLMVAIFNKALADKWQISSPILISTSVTTIAITIIATIGALRLHAPSLLFFLLFSILLFVCLLVLAWTRFSLLPLMAIEMAATGTAFLYLQTLRKAINEEVVEKPQLSVELNMNLR